MLFLKFFHSICIFAVVMTFTIACESIAGDNNVTIIDMPAISPTKVHSLEPPVVLETARITSTGTFYRIDADNYAYYEKPKLYSFLVNTPSDIVDWLKESFQAKNALTITGIAVVTGGLIAVDQNLNDAARDVGHTLHISGDSTNGRAGPGGVIEYPKDLGTTIYSIGNGVVPIAISAGMLSYGLVTSDVRSLQTSSQLMEGLLTVAIVDQTIKRITGRQTPGHATKSGGKWQFFPNVKDYSRDIPSYDAFPSGHMATAMMTVTVLADNYPEYSLIKPVGYGLMTLLGFQMMNNGVHWASDYPLALAIGYGLGKVAVSKGRKIVTEENVPKKESKNLLFTDMAVIPMPLNNGGGLYMVAKF